MTSKEFIQNEIDNLEDILYNAKRDNCKVVIKQCEEDIEQYNQVLKDLERLEAIDNAKPSEALKAFERLNKDDSDYALKRALKDIEIVKQALLKAQDNEELKIDICEMFGLDNLFPYNDTEEIIKELEEYMDRKNQLWVDFMKTSKQLKKQDKILELLKKCYYASSIDETLYKTSYGFDNPQDVRKIGEWLENDF